MVITIESFLMVLGMHVRTNERNAKVSLRLVAATSLTAAKNGGIQSRTMLNGHIITKTSCHIYEFVTITIKDAK